MATVTPVFPAAVATDAQLKVANNLVKTALKVSAAATDTILFVNSTAGFVPNCLVSIDKEIISVASIAAGPNPSLVVASGGRGFDGTSAAQHSAGAQVSMLIDAWHHNAVAAEVKAIQGFIGPNGQNLAALVNGPWVFSQMTNFAAQAPGGSLTVGTNVVTLTPVPAGVNGTDKQHYLYISGGTGAAEAVLITGGTAVSGAASGTVFFTCANTHSGAWTIRSASGGIKEAANTVNGIGSIVMPLGVINLYAPLVLPTTVNLSGVSCAQQPSQATKGTILVAQPAADPAILIGEDYPTDYGVGIHHNYRLLSNGSTRGLFIGGDPAGIASPTTYFANYTKCHNISVEGFSTGVLILQHQDFSTFYSCLFNGIVLIPSTADGLQYTDFYDCVVSVGSGKCFQMDANSAGVGTINFFGGQISGTVVGTAVGLSTWGTHYEPNASVDACVDITGGYLNITGGLMGVHGAAPFLIRVGGSNLTLFHLNGTMLVGDAAVPNAIVWQNTGGGDVSIRDIPVLAITFNFAAGLIKFNTFPGNLIIEIAYLTNMGQGTITASATITFPQMNYPHSRALQIVGATVGGSGITAVAGLLQGQSGMLYTASAQTFTAGGTIGNTITTAVRVPYNYFFDGSQIWIH